MTDKYRRVVKKQKGKKVKSDNEVDNCKQTDE